MVVLQPPDKSQQLRERGGMDNASPELCWVDTWPAEVPDQLQTVWGQRPVPGDRDMGSPDKGRSVAAASQPMSPLSAGVRPGAAPGTNSKGTMTSIPNSSVFKGRIAQTTSAFGYTGEAPAGTWRKAGTSAGR